MWTCGISVSIHPRWKEKCRLREGPGKVGLSYVLQRVNALGSFLDLASDGLGDKLGGELLQIAARGLALDDLGHLSPDGPDLGCGGIRGLLDLVGAALREGDGEESEEVIVGGLDGDVGLDQGLPLSHQGPQLVRGEVQTVEVGQAVLALNLIDSELDLPESVVLVLLQIRQGDLEDPALQSVVRVLHTRGSVDERLADTVGCQVRYAQGIYIASSAVLLSDVEGGRRLS